MDCSVCYKKSTEKRLKNCNLGDLAGLGFGRTPKVGGRLKGGVFQIVIFFVQDEFFPEVGGSS